MSGTALQAEPDAAAGETLFKQNCSACHAINAKRVGPALAGVNAKYAGDEEWLYSWIRNAPGLIAKGDPKAVALYEQYNKQAMQAFPTFTDDDIANILEYIEVGDKPAEAVATTQVAGQGGGGSLNEDPTVFYALLGLVGVLVLIALLLVVITATLVTAIRAKEQKEAFNWSDAMARSRTLLTNKFVITAIATIATIGGLAKWAGEARTIGLHQGYMPEQPIAFAHSLHAGTYEIDCKYCHSGTYKSKSAWIPGANVCMNCHKQIQYKEYPNDPERTEYSKQQIAKIYASIGWDPDNFAYIDNYEEKPIEWVRIHNLPDHAYFNHAQHVVVGNLECQTCHGPIQEMEVVYQYSDLGMGWCINCHRNEKVKVLGEDTDMTVADMGGLNCARCHY
jgi:mono/diheme cytochrome c family protein